MGWKPALREEASDSARDVDSVVQFSRAAEAADFMFAGKPIIGIAGGIGGGKSLIARLFGELGCFVIDADAQVKSAYERASVRQTLREWWGEAVFCEDGTVNRGEVARRIFSSEADRRRLEQYLHPLIVQERRERMEKASKERDFVAFVWDTPLLFEAGHAGECDAVVFVESSRSARLERLARDRRWTEAQLVEREKLQMPLDKKREISDYVIRNTADAAFARDQVQKILSRIVFGLSVRPEGA
jgi:dephospho-CoA kinase